LKLIADKRAITKMHAAIIIAIIVIAAFVGIGAYYYSTNNSSTKEIVIGCPLPLSGGQAASGIDMQNGFALAEQDINAAGGIQNLGGEKIKFVFADTQSDATVSLTATQRIISTDNPVMMTGYYNGPPTMSAIQATEPAKIPLLMPLLTTVSLTTSNYSYVFRNAMRADKSGPLLLDSLIAMGQQYGTPIKTIALLSENDFSIQNFTRTEAVAKGLQVVYYGLFAPGTTDFSTIAQQIKAAKPDAVLAFSVMPESTLIAQAFKEFQVDAVCYAGFGGFLEPSFISTLGNASQYYLAISGWMRDQNVPGLADIVNRYEAKYNMLMNEHAGQSYTSAWIIKDVLELSAQLHPNDPLSGDSIRDAFLKIDITSGPATYAAGGNVQFSTNGDNIHGSEVIMQIINGTQHTVWPLSKASATAVWPMPSWENRP
jgi:branched-chain amino acid transport system substrate-binding protein